MHKKESEQKTLTILSFWKEYWYVALGILFFLMLVIAQLFRVLTPKIIPIQQNSWQGLTPGYSRLEDVVGNLGQPLSTEDIREGTALYYQSDFPVFPDEVIVNTTNTVQFIKEFVPYNADHTLQQYTQEFGQPDLELYDQDTGYASKAYVFLQQGLVIIAHISGQTVEQKWYFVPTTQQEFLQSWGKNLTDQGNPPEEFDPNL